MDYHAGSASGRNDDSRSIDCDGPLVRRIRRKQGLTQAELARLAGFSERVIRKIERGDTVSLLALRSVAKALNQTTQPLAASDLIVSPRRKVSRLLQRLGEPSRDWADHEILRLFDGGVTLVCRCAGCNNDLDGVWSGPGEVREWFARATELAGMNHQQRNFNLIGDGRDVVAWPNDLEEGRGEQVAATYWTIARFSFSANGIMSIDIRIQCDGAA